MDLIFETEFKNDFLIVRIRGNNVLFSNQSTNFQFYPIDNLVLSKEGILKEHPDLKDLSDAEIRQEAIRRVKEKIKLLSSEERIKDYIVNELKEHYTLKKIRRDGFR